MHEGSITLQVAKSDHYAIKDIFGHWETDAAGEEIFLNSAFAINSKDFGCQGVQIQYNNGRPRLYVGDGVDRFIGFDGTNPNWRGEYSELNLNGKLTCSGGLIGGWTITADTIESTNLTIDSANEKIYSNNYVAGPAGAGFLISPDLVEAGNLAARGILRMAVFQKDVISAIGGNLLIGKGSDVLAEDIADDSGEMVIEGNETFAVGDILRIKDDIDDEWFQVTDVSSDLVTYTVERDKDDAYGSSESSFAGLPAWKKGATVVNYGASGDGLIHMTASETNAPHLKVLTHAGAPWDALNERLRIGNLNGYLGYSSDTYGIGIGNTDSFIKCDPTNGIQIQVTAADAITVKAGGDIKLEADASDPGAIKFVGSSYSSELGDFTADGTIVGFKPLTDNATYLALGLATNRCKAITLYSSLGFYFYDYIDSDNNLLLYSQCDSLQTGFVIKCTAGGDDKNIIAYHEYESDVIDFSSFYPNEDNVWDLGRFDQRWKDFYAVTATLSNTGLHLFDTNASHDLIIAPGSDLTADRTLILTTGDANRTLTINGNATLNDWFDQSVKISASPTFAALTVTGAITSGGDAIAKIKTGSYTGDGTTSQAIIGVGFNPKFIKIWYYVGDGNNTEIWESTSEMNARDPQGLAVVHPWDGSHAQYDNRILSHDADGFTVSDDGVDGHPNKNGVTYDYICLGI